MFRSYDPHCVFQVLKDVKKLRKSAERKEHVESQELKDIEPGAIVMSGRLVHTFKHAGTRDEKTKVCFDAQ